MAYNETSKETSKQADRPRRKVPPIKVWVTDTEKAELTERAAQAGLSLSAYMLAAGLVLDAVNAMPGRSSQKAATLAAELRERPDLMQAYQPLLAPHQRTLQRSRGGMER